MKLEFMLLSDAAISAKDGVFSALNCGLDCFGSSEFPARKSSLVVVVRVLFDPIEFELPQDFTLEIFGPRGERLDPTIPVTVTPVRHKRHPERPNHMTIALTIYSLGFQEPGFHMVRFTSGNRILGEAPLEVFRSEDST